jgi:hypothetical protein
MAESGSASESGSTSQRYGSADPDLHPDPHQNFMDPQHWCLQHLYLGSSTLHTKYPQVREELPDNIWSMDDGLNDIVPDERPVLLVHGEGNGRTGRVRLTLLPRLAHLPDIFGNLNHLRINIDAKND